MQTLNKEIYWKSILILLLVLSCSIKGTVNAQTEQNDMTGSTGITSVSNANNEMSVNNNVNLSLGSIAPAIPITSISSGNLVDNISLVYISGNGIRVNESANDVGLGWKLQVGGSITRTIKGKRDDTNYFLG